MRLKVISGGQTGVDQVFLELAEEFGLETGGWMPAGCRTHEGPRPDLLARFKMREHNSTGYSPRTYANVRDSDLTIWFGAPSAGYVCTRNGCRRFRKPFIENETAERIWREICGVAHLFDSGLVTVNGAGNRLHTNPQASLDARRVMAEVFQKVVQTW